MQVAFVTLEASVASLEWAHCTSGEAQKEDYIDAE